MNKNSIFAMNDVLCGSNCKFYFGRRCCSGLFKSSILVLFVVLFPFLPVTGFITVVKHFNKRTELFLKAAN